MLIPRKKTLQRSGRTDDERSHRFGIWARAADATTIFANAAVVLALLVAYVTYTGQREAEAAEAARTLELAKLEYSVRTISRLAEGRVGEARDYLYAELLRTGLDQFSDLPNDIALRGRIVQSIAATAEDPDRLKISVAAIVEYYDQVAACIKTDLCDKAVLAEHIGQYAGRFGCFFDATIVEMREELGDAHYGASLELWRQSQRCGGGAG